MFLLTSTGLSNPPTREYLQSNYDLEGFRVAIVTTAAEWKEENKYSKLAYQQFVDLGVKEAFFFDIEKDNMSLLKNINMIYVCGGNTFNLAAAINKSDFKTMLVNHMKNWWIYIGVSAGSIVIWPDISIAWIGISPHENLINLQDMHWMNLINEIIFPHYTSEDEPVILEYEKLTHKKVTRLTDDQFIKKI